MNAVLQAYTSIAWPVFAIHMVVTDFSNWKRSMTYGILWPVAFLAVLVVEVIKIIEEL